MEYDARLGINVTALFRIWLRLMELKAFLKSICNIPASCENCNFSKVILVACMILSAPPLNPTPSCLDDFVCADTVCVCLAMHFATKRQKTSPRAIGRTPPFNFFKAVKRRTAENWCHWHGELTSAGQIH